MASLAESRTEFHKKLVRCFELVHSDSKKRIWFNPSPNDKLIYPCIVYTRQSDTSRYGDNERHIRSITYQVTVIDRDSDSEIVDAILDNITYSRLSDEMVVDGLYHFIITIPHWSH